MSQPPADAPRSLLFGLLALQTGLVSQAALVAAFHAWTLAKNRPMAEILVEQGALDSSRRALIEGLLGEHLKMHGDDPDRSLAALGAGPSTRERLAQIGDVDLDQSLARVGPAMGDEPSADPNLTTPSDSPKFAGQRYRVVRTHARGGLGEVFVAIDSEFNREVALKEIQARHADNPDSRARFLLEAEVTGGLEHPGIVPVYGLGTYADGRPYYAMRFIRGDSLKEAITAFHADEALKRDPGRRSLELRKLLRRFLDVCNAIEYAHQRGVLHRDLKPGNIMVGRYGETLVVDWGLAKIQGRTLDREATTGERSLMPSSGSGSAETVAGTAIGTPAYMSPEQAAGDLANLGPRSDVYSLGATLYCLLTGKPPFERADLGESLRAVQKGEFPRPRTIDPTIDAPLEAVCLKAMALNPADRYGSPKALADDVERWAADEPVTAYPESVRSRLGRWGRRHRAWVQAGTASLALMVVVAVLFAVEKGRFADRLLGEQKKTKDALIAETVQRKKTAAALGAATEQRNKAIAERELANSRLYFVNMNSVQRFWEDYNPSLFLQFLDDQLPEHQQDGIDRRGFEWYYWERKFSSGHHTLKGHTNYVTSVAFSPDGKRLASASGDNTVMVRDATTGQVALTLKGHTDSVASVAFSPDGKRIASASYDQTVKIWDAATGQEALTLKGFADGVKSVTFSPDGKRIASENWDNTVKVWDATTGQEALTLKGHTGSVESVAFSPDGKRIASASADHTVKMWDAATGQEVLTLKGHADSVESVAFSPDGKRIASASHDNTVKVWDAATGQEVLTLKGHTDLVSSVAFSPDGKRIASASYDQTVKVWDAVTGQEALTLKGHTNTVDSVAFSPDGKRIASASYDQTVKIWDAATGQEALTLKGHANWVTSVAFSPDGKRIASASYDNTVKVWDAATGQEALTLKGHAGGVIGFISVAFSPDGERIASASDDQTVKVWDAATGQEALTLKGHANGVISVAFSPDGKRIASASYDRTVKVWDAATGQEALTLKGHASTVTSVAFSPDGKRIASASYDQTVKVWDAATGQEALTFKGHADLVASVAFSPDGKRLASASRDKTVKVWDATTGQETLSLKEHTNWVQSVAFSPDGMRLASASRDKTVKVWDARPLDPAENDRAKP